MISQPSSTFAASSQEQVYVSASRARLSATWITDNKAALREAVSRSEARPSALDLVEARGVQPGQQVRQPKAKGEEAALRENLRKMPAPKPAHGPDREGPWQAPPARGRDRGVGR